MNGAKGAGIQPALNQGAGRDDRAGRDGSGRDGAVWLSGWEAIEAATGFKAKTLRDLMRHEGLPIIIERNRPITSPELLQGWLRQRVERAAGGGMAGDGAYRAMRR